MKVKDFVQFVHDFKLYFRDEDGNKKEYVDVCQWYVIYVQPTNFIETGMIIWCQKEE